jgi:hypothetical protein
VGQWQRVLRRATVARGKSKAGSGQLPPDKDKGTLSWISPQLRALAIPVEGLHPDPWNAKTHPIVNMDALRASLKKFGQMLPFIVQKKGMVVRVGNARLQVARELGWTHVAAVVTEDPDAVAAAFAIAENRSAELGSWDYKHLATLIEELQGEDVLDAIGFDSEAQDRILARASRAAGADEPEKPTTVKQHRRRLPGGKFMAVCPKCSHEFEPEDPAE